MMIKPRIINIVVTRRCWSGIILMYVLCRNKKIADILGAELVVMSSIKIDVVWSVVCAKSFQWTYVPQLFSSSPLGQSFEPSHTAFARRHLPWQVNLLEGHPQSSSSDLSLHAKSPSHRRFFLTHSPFLQVNCLSLHLKPEKFGQSSMFIEKHSRVIFVYSNCNTTILSNYNKYQCVHRLSF